MILVVQMLENNELQEMILTYRILESRLDSLLKQRDILTSKFVEAQSTIQSIDEMGKGENGILFPIGSETYVVGDVKDRGKIVVEIGANIALEKTPGEAKLMLEKRKAEIEGALNTVQSNIIEISNRMEKLEPEIRELSKNLQKDTEEN
jgi:prefoldin alpha subunit